ncbi:MAG: O-antigen ligase family protein, partial [Candidatus Eisenbacteria bacterium]
MSEARAGRVCDVALVVLACALPLSIAVSEITLGVVLLAWLGTRPWRRTPTPAWRLVALASGGLVATWLLASATAGDPVASLVKARKLWSLALLLIVADRARCARLGDHLSLAALLAGGVSAAFGIAAHVAERLAPSFAGKRLESVFSTAMTSGNVFATLLVAGLGEILARRLSGARRLVGVLVVACLAIALLGTQTRSAWLAVLAGTGFLLVRRQPRLLLVLAALVSLVVTLGPGELRERAASVLDPTHPGNAGRVSLWKSGAAALADRPWTGVGLADHYDFIERYRRPDATFHAGHFHNNLVQVAVSTGLVGLV